MDETLKIIMERRSVRSYKTDQIPDETLELILKTGMFAPNGMGRQAWHFTVVQNRDLLDRIKKLSTFYDAPTLIIVSIDKKAAVTPEFDCATALENMFLAAASKGVSSCWINAISSVLASENAKEFIKDLGIPSGYTVICAGAFGYNAGKMPSPAPRKENIINIIK